MWIALNKPVTHCSIIGYPRMSSIRTNMYLLKNFTLYAFAMFVRRVVNDNPR